MLKKLFIIFMLVMLPMHFSQAATCSYCPYETPVTQENNADQAEGAIYLAADQHNDSTQGNGIHNACGVCHLCCAKLIPSQTSLYPRLDSVLVLTPESINHYTFIPHVIDRPNWPFAV